MNKTRSRIRLDRLLLLLMGCCLTFALLILMIWAAFFKIQDSNNLRQTQPLETADRANDPNISLAPLPFAESTLPILSAPRSTQQAAQRWALARQADPLFIELIPVFWQEAEAVGVDPLVAYCQSALETGFMHFSSVVPATFHNPCGLKTTLGGGDTERLAHAQFPDWPTGIRAQIDHLALYAGHADYPREDSPDPRAFEFLKGTAPEVESLGGRWAPSQDYGQILRRLMEEVHAYDATQAP